jgi:hypothetical protein
MADRNMVNEVADAPAGVRTDGPELHLEVLDAASDQLTQAFRQPPRQARSMVNQAVEQLRKYDFERVRRAVEDGRHEARGHYDRTIFNLKRAADAGHVQAQRLLVSQGIVVPQARKQ